MEADVTPDTKTHERTESAASGDRATHIGDSSSAMKVDIGPTSLACFGMMAELPALSCCRGDALVDKGAEAPKSCLSPVEMRTQAATGGLLPAGTAFTAMKTIVSGRFLLDPR